MKLTGKCKETFGNQCEYDYSDIIKLPEIFQNALIIEFFDSVGIYVIISYGHISNSWIYEVNGIADNFFTSRTKATNAAIEKANEIFNNI